MHAAHIIAVEADNADEAMAAVEHALSPYGDGQVWDWFSIGGRWEGSLEGSNVLQCSANPQAFRAAVEEAIQCREAAFRRVQDKVVGRTVTPADLPDAVFGIPVGDKKSAAENVSQDNKKMRREVNGTGER